MTTVQVGLVPLRTPWVGREAELRTVDEALERAVATGQPQTVTVVGGAGTGKTRLMDEVVGRIAHHTPNARCFRGAGRVHGPAFGILQRLLRHRFGLVEGTSLELQRETVRAVVSEALGADAAMDFLHFIGVYLDLRWPESAFAKAFEDDPDQVARIGQAVLRRFFEVDAGRGPLVLVFEDLHLANDDSLALVESLVASMHDAPVLMVVTARPELLARRPEWGEAGSPRHTRMELMPLGLDDAARIMLHLLSPTEDPPEALVDAAVEVAGGNPYLLEQMFRAFLSSGTVVPRDDGPWIVHLERLDDAQLPLSVEDAVTARISALTAPERELLELASIVGGVFWLGALVTLGRMGRAAPDLWGGAEDLASHVRDLLAGLAERDYVLPIPGSAMAGDEEFAFKHNLEREALYRLAGPTQARRAHRTFAEWFEVRLTERTEEQCELLGFQYERAGVARKAAEYLLAAGDRARARYANTKAAEYYRRALPLLGDDDVVRQLEVHHHHGDVLQLAGRNDEAIASFRTMLAIAWRLDLKAKGGAAHNRIGRVFRAVGQLEEAMRHLGTGHALFDAVQDTRGIASSLDDVGKVHWMRGAYDAAERFMRQSLELRRELGDLRSTSLSLNNLGLVYQDSGRFAEALLVYREALHIREQIGDRPGIAQTLNNLGTIHQDSGDHPRATEVWTQALEHARTVGDRMRQAVILTNLGESAYRQQEPDRAIEVLHEAEALSSTLGDRILEAEILRGLAKAHMLRHDLPQASEFIGRSITLFERARSRPFLAVAVRTAAEIRAASGRHARADVEARAMFERAKGMFEELGNQMEIARTCDAFASFLEADPDSIGEAGRGEEARALRQQARDIVSGMGVPTPVRGTRDPLGVEPTSPGPPSFEN